MVRHEAAEALGGIASDGEEGGVLEVLREWAAKADAPVVVRESCQVAIDMWEVSSLPISPVRCYPQHEARAGTQLTHRLVRKLLRAV